MLTKVKWHTTQRSHEDAIEVVALTGYMITVIPSESGPKAIIDPADGGSLVGVDYQRVTVVSYISR